MSFINLYRDFNNDNFNFSKYYPFGYQSTQPNLHYSKRSWCSFRIRYANASSSKNLRTQRRWIYWKYDRTYRNAYRRRATKSAYLLAVRIFSLRGAHLIAMFARTKVAKDFRKWVLDILDREVSQKTKKSNRLLNANTPSNSPNTNSNSLSGYGALTAKWTHYSVNSKNRLRQSAHVSAQWFTDTTTNTNDTTSRPKIPSHA